MYKSCLSNFSSSSSSMLPTRTILSKSKNSISFCLTTSVRFAYLNKFHNCKPNKCFVLSLSQNRENASFPLNGGSWSKSATVKLKDQRMIFKGIVIIISLNIESKSFHKSLDTIESSSIIKNFTSDNLFLKAALDLHLNQVALFQFYSKTRMNSGPTYIYCW